MFVTVPGWWLNNGGAGPASFAQPGALDNLLGVLGLLTSIVLALILTQGRWHSQWARPAPKKPRHLRSVAPARR